MKSLDGVLTKKAHAQIAYTDSQIEEFIKCADPKTGPAYFMNHFFYIQHPTKGKLLYKAYPFQDGLIDNYHNFRFSINLLSRQTGKCLTFNTFVINNNKQIQIGDLLWKGLTLKQKIITKLENWLIKLAKSADAN